MRHDIEQGIEYAKEYKCSALLIKKELREVESMLVPGESVIFVCNANASAVVSRARVMCPTLTNKKPGMFMLTNKRVMHLGITMGKQDFHQIFLTEILSTSTKWGFADELVFEYANGSLSVDVNKKAANKIISIVNELQQKVAFNTMPLNASQKMPAPAPGPSLMFCKHCGKKISSDSMFCRFCGGKQD